MVKTKPILGSKFFSLFWCGIFSLALVSCQELESEKPNTAKQVIDATRSTVTGAGGEVGIGQTVTVRLMNARGSGVFKVVPTIVAVDGTGTVVTTVTSGGCSATDGRGVSTCSLTSTLPGSYTLKVTSPAVFTGGTITFTQVTRSLRFSTQPGTTATSGAAFATQPVVELLDRVGNRNVTGTDFVAVALASAGSATLGGTTTGTGVAGLVTFTNLEVDLAGTYSLVASSGSATAVNSQSFTVSADVAARLGFIRQPSSSSPAYIAFSTQPSVAVQDAQGNTVNSNCIITIGLSAPTGADVFAGTFSRAASAGISDFTGAGLRVNSLVGGTTYTLSATASGSAGCVALTAATSSQFEITLAGVPAQLSLVSLLVDEPLYQTWSRQPVLQVRDAFGNLVSTDNSTVVTITRIAGTGALAGSTSVTAVNGTVTFTNLRINSNVDTDAGVYSYRFNGLSSGVSLTPLVTSQTITSNGLLAPFSWEFSVPPQNSSRGATMSPVTVRRVDANGFLNTSDSATTVALTANGGGTLGGGAAHTLLNGTTTFSSLVITGVSGVHSLTATTGTGGATTTETSTSFAISDFGTASRLGFTTQPSGGANPWATQPVVAIQDSAGNTVSSDNSTVVTLSVLTSTGGDTTLTGNTSLTAVNGVVTFTNLGVLQTGRTGISLQTTSNSALTNAVSTSFNGAP